MKKISAVILGLVMVLALGSAATASSLNVNFGGTLQLGYYYDPAYKNIDDVSWLSYYQLTLEMSKNFGDLGSAGLSFKTSGGLYGLNNPWGLPYEAPHNWGNANGFKFNSWYYDYKVSDALTVGLTAADGGVSISDGQLTSNSDWQNVCGFKAAVKYRSNNEMEDSGSGDTAYNPSPMQLPTVLKVVAKPVDGLTAQLYYYPVDQTYIIKGVYQGENFKIGGGFNNISGKLDETLNTNPNDDIPDGTKYLSKLRDDNGPLTAADLDLSWAVYGEFSPVDGVKVGAEYREDEDYLLSASAQVLDNLKVDFLYSTRSKLSAGYVLYRAYTADFKGTYDLGDGNIIAGGIAFDTHQSELARVHAEYTFDKFTVGISDELVKQVYTGDPRGTLSSSTNAAYGVSVYGSYKLDGSNTLKASYNFESGVWAAYMQISLW